MSGVRPPRVCRRRGGAAADCPPSQRRTRGRRRRCRLACRLAAGHSVLNEPRSAPRSRGDSAACSLRLLPSLVVGAASKSPKSDPKSSPPPASGAAAAACLLLELPGGLPPAAAPAAETSAKELGKALMGWASSAASSRGSGGSLGLPPQTMRHPSDPPPQSVHPDHQAVAVSSTRPVPNADASLPVTIPSTGECSFGDGGPEAHGVRSPSLQDETLWRLETPYAAIAQNARLVIKQSSCCKQNQKQVFTETVTVWCIVMCTQPALAM